MRSKTRPEMKPTKYPGVFLLPSGRYHVRQRATNPRTGRMTEVDKQLSAKSAADASAQLSALIQAKLGGKAERPRERQSVWDCSQTWLKLKKPELAPSTYDRYKRTLDNHLQGTSLAEILIDAPVTHHDVKGWRNALLEPDAYRGTALSPTTVNSIFRVVATMLQDIWVAYGLPGTCPAERIAAIDEPDPHPDEKPNMLKRGELDELLAAVLRLAPRWYALFCVMAFTGMRIGEATVLRWQDLREHDDDHGPHIFVRRSQWRGIVRERTKGGAHRRPPLPDDLRDVLREHRRDQLAAQATPSIRAQANALRRAESGWLFPQRGGQGPVGTQTVRNVLLDVQARILEEMERGPRLVRSSDAEGPARAVPRYLALTPHGLRRTLNNLLRQVAPGLVVREVIGHASERMTARYSRVEGAEKRAAVTRALGPKSPT